MATRANFETTLVRRAGPIMSKAGMAVTYAGANADLADPIAWALIQMGYSVSDITTPTSAECAAVSDADLFDVLDLAEYRLLSSLLTNLDDVDVQQGPQSEKLSQLIDRIKARLDDLVEVTGAGVGSLEVGVVTLEFAEHSDGS